MQRQNTPEGAILTFDTFRDAVTVFRAVDDYFPGHPLVQCSENSEDDRRMTLPEIIGTVKPSSGEVIHFQLSIEESAIVAAALTKRAREGKLAKWLWKAPTSWDQAQAADILKSMRAEQRSVRSRLAGAFAGKTLVPHLSN